jgi:hypothetical protein
MTQVVETGSRLKEALHAHCHLEEALKDARSALEATEAEVEAARLTADGAEARRIGIFFRRFLSLWLPSWEELPNFLYFADMEERTLDLLKDRNGEPERRGVNGSR